MVIQSFSDWLTSDYSVSQLTSDYQDKKTKRQKRHKETKTKRQKDMRKGLVWWVSGVEGSLGLTELPQLQLCSVCNPESSETEERWNVTCLKKIIYILYIQMHKHNLHKYTNTLKYAHKYSLFLGEKCATQSRVKPRRDERWHARHRAMQCNPSDENF